MSLVKQLANKWGSESKANKEDLLLRYFKSSPFDVWLALQHLYTSTQAGVQDYLANRLHELSEEAVEQFLLQFVYLAVSRPGSALERTIVELCSKTFRVAIKTQWLLVALCQDHPKNKTLESFRERAYKAALEGKWEVPIRNPKLDPLSPYASNVLASPTFSPPFSPGTSLMLAPTMPPPLSMLPHSAVPQRNTAANGSYGGGAVGPQPAKQQQPLQHSSAGGNNGAQDSDYHSPTFSAATAVPLANAAAVPAPMHSQSPFFHAHNHPPVVQPPGHIVMSPPSHGGPGSTLAAAAAAAGISGSGTVLSNGSVGGASSAVGTGASERAVAVTAAANLLPVLPVALPGQQGQEGAGGGEPGLRLQHSSGGAGLTARKSGSLQIDLGCLLAPEQRGLSLSAGQGVVSRQGSMGGAAGPMSSTQPPMELPHRIQSLRRELGEGEGVSALLERSAKNTAAGMVAAEDEGLMSDDEFGGRPMSPLTRLRYDTFGATLDFVDALCDASSALTNYSQDERHRALRVGLEHINREIEAANRRDVAIWFPMGRGGDRVLRLTAREAVLLNSREKAPFMLFVEVLEGQNECGDPYGPAPPPVVQFGRRETYGIALTGIGAQHQQQYMHSSYASSSCRSDTGSPVPAGAGPSFASAASVMSVGSSGSLDTLGPLPGAPGSSDNAGAATGAGQGQAAAPGQPCSPSSHAPSGAVAFGSGVIGSGGSGSSSATGSFTRAGKAQEGASGVARSLCFSGGMGGRELTEEEIAELMAAGCISPPPVKSDPTMASKLSGLLASLRGEAPMVRVRIRVLPQPPAQQPHFQPQSLKQQDPQPSAAAVGGQAERPGAPADAGAGFGSVAPSLASSMHGGSGLCNGAGVSSNLLPLEHAAALATTADAAAGAGGDPSLAASGSFTLATLSALGGRAKAALTSSSSAAAAAPVSFEVAQGVNLAIPSPYRKSRRTPSHEAIEMLAGKYKIQHMPPPYDGSPATAPMDVTTAAAASPSGTTKLGFAIGGGVLASTGSPPTPTLQHRTPSTAAPTPPAASAPVGPSSSFLGPLGGRPGTPPSSADGPSSSGGGPSGLAASLKSSLTTMLSRASGADKDKDKPPSDPASHATNTPTTGASPRGGSPVTDGKQERESLEERRRREAVAVYGERWAAKVKRIQRESPHGRRAGWALRCVIVKSGDDCRQELLALQLIKVFGDIFREAGLPLWVRPYEVLVTSNRTALIEMVPNTLSLHTIKSRSPPSTSLSDHFFAKFGRAGSPGCTAAQRRFTESLAAYSLICYLLQIKDRHNGNILLDDDGRIVHIDFGFLLSNSPGGVNFESAPFKLTRELLEVMDSNSDGRPSEMFDYFKVLMIQGFLAMRKQADRILLLTRMMHKSGFPCYKAGERAVKALEKRMQMTLTEVQCVAHVLQLIAESLDAWRTRQYDYYQRVLNGIL
eukprot:XP_001691394.1 smilar to phosphatidylinositol 3- or 4-kinase [Chlamydomonas reinhardtii]